MAPPQTQQQNSWPFLEFCNHLLLLGVFSDLRLCRGSDRLPFIETHWRCLVWARHAVDPQHIWVPGLMDVNWDECQEPTQQTARVSPMFHINIIYIYIFILKIVPCYNPSKAYFTLVVSFWLVPKNFPNKAVVFVAKVERLLFPSKLPQCITFVLLSCGFHQGSWVHLLWQRTLPKTF